MIKSEQIVEKNRKIIDLLQDFGFSYADCNKMLRNKDVKVDGRAIKENLEVLAGQNVVFYYSSDMLEKKYEIIFQNDDAVIVYKAAGIETAGEKGIESVIPDAIAVHRIDRNTEGLVVFAKNEKTKIALEKAFKGGLVHKKYVAEVVGEFDMPEKIYSAYLLKDEKTSTVKIFQNKVPKSVQIQTKIKPLKVGDQSSLVEVELLTGKTHQIRAHLAFLGHAIVGDGKYGKNETNKKFKEKRQKLACVSLKFDFVGVDGLNFQSFSKYPKWFENK